MVLRAVCLQWRPGIAAPSQWMALDKFACFDTGFTGLEQFERSLASSSPSGRIREDRLLGAASTELGATAVRPHAVDETRYREV